MSHDLDAAACSVSIHSFGLVLLWKALSQLATKFGLSGTQEASGSGQLFLNVSRRFDVLWNDFHVASVEAQNSTWQINKHWIQYATLNFLGELHSGRGLHRV